MRKKIEKMSTYTCRLFEKRENEKKSKKKKRNDFLKRTRAK